MLPYLSPRTFQAVVDVSWNYDSPLGRPVRQAMDLIDAVLSEDGEDAVAISFNGGKDCTVLLHLLAATLWHRRSTTAAPALETLSIDNRSPEASGSTPFKALYVTCSSPFSEVDAFVQQCAVSYPLDLYETTPGGLPMREALWQYHDKFPEVKSILVGTRIDDPHGGKLQLRNPTDDGWPPYQRVHPILHWTYEQIWEYLRQFEVPYCDLYDRGYTSLGSTYNTHPNPALLEGNGRYRPAYELKDGSKERSGRTRWNPESTSVL